MSQLDFGLPFLYQGLKKTIDEKKELLNIASHADVILISQGFDDHAHAPTLRALTSMNGKLKYVCPPSAVPILESCGISKNDVAVLKPTESIKIMRHDRTVVVTATSGALLGPPGGMVENGYILQANTHSGGAEAEPTVYYEPHCMYNAAELSRLHADVVITSVVMQRLLGYTLVDGGKKAMELAGLLRAKCIVPMRNGDLQQSGMLSKLVTKVGSEKDFVTLGSEQYKVVLAPPGQIIQI